MFINGGFAGHGAVRGVTVTPGELRRTCNDCHYSWSADDDDHTRRWTSCVAGPMGAGVPEDAEAVGVAMAVVLPRK